MRTRFVLVNNNIKNGCKILYLKTRILNRNSENNKYCNQLKIHSLIFVYKIINNTSILNYSLKLNNY